MSKPSCDEAISFTWSEVSTSVGRVVSIHEVAEIMAANARATHLVLMLILLNMLVVIVSIFFRDYQNVTFTPPEMVAEGL